MSIESNSILQNIFHPAFWSAPFPSFSIALKLFYDMNSIKLKASNTVEIKCNNYSKKLIN